MRITEQQKRRLFMEYTKTGNIEQASLKSGMTRKTGAKYLRCEVGQAGEQRVRSYKTRANPFAEHWKEITGHLEREPHLEAKTLFEWLCMSYPERGYHEGQLRSLQRHIRKWRVLRGPEKEVFFPQEHKAGRRMQTDFTHMGELGISIQGKAFSHLLCHSVLTYSNWEWATICFSESFISLCHGVQTTLRRLGYVPLEHWTDHSTAATHVVGGLEGRKRGFNPRYVEWMEHLGMEPRTIQVGKPNENGDVESLNGGLKNRLNQQLLMRGFRDFESEEKYRQFLEETIQRGNVSRSKRLQEEMNVMKSLSVDLFPEYTIEQPRVTKSSTIQVDRKTYSVPSRMIGEEVKVLSYEDYLEVYYADTLQLTIPRLRGEKQHAINYRHIIEWLIRKPAAFRDYRYREDMFPSLVFRKAYDRLCAECSPIIADREYLRILRLAAKTMESRVEDILRDLEQKDQLPRYQQVRELCGESDPVEVPIILPFTINLKPYNLLLENQEVAL